MRIARRNIRRVVRRCAAKRGLHFGLTLVICCALAVLYGVPTFAQVSGGAIFGTVTDSSGGRIPNVHITLIDEATQGKRDTTSSSLGDYRFPFVPVGTYSLRAEVAGFQTETLSHVILHVNDQYRHDFTLQVGTAAQSVSVTASPVSVNSENPILGGLVDTRRVEQLPLNGRAFLTLANLAPGAIDVTAPGAEDNATGVAGGRQGQAASFSGVRSVDTEILIDGIPSKNLYENNIGIQPTPDEIEEFKALQGYITPDYGGPGAVSVVTKSGTNQYHGALWEFLRNDKLDARSTFETKVAVLRQNQFGAAGGGPIIKNKLFFFGSYEGEQIRGASNASLANVPLPAFFNGDFSSVATPIIDPLNGQPFLNNQIPTDRISSFAEAAQQFWPSPTPDAPEGFNFRGTSQTRESDNKFMVRIDWSKSEKDKIFGRFSYSNIDRNNVGAFPFSGSEIPIQARNLSINWTHVFSPKMVNIVRVGLDRVFLANGSPYNSANNPDFGSILGLQNLKQPASCNSLTTITTAEYTGVGGSRSCEVPTNNNLIYSDNLSYFTGRHNIMLGGDIIQYREQDIVSFSANGEIDFTGQFSGNGAADLILGYPATASGGQWQGPT